MSHIRTSSILRPALLFLVYALVLPGSYSGALSKGGYFADQFESVASFQKDLLGKSEGDDQKLIPPTDRSTTVSPGMFSALSSRSTSASDVPFSVKQARAPPLS